MGAPEGNKNALGNEGGRPPIYDGNNPDDVEKVNLLSEQYFTYIQGEYEPIPKSNDDDQQEYKCVRRKEPPTVTGLALYLGFESKNTLYDYSKKVEFSDSIKKALTKIEQHHEIAVSYGEKCAGNIFILSNFGWKNQMAVDHTTKGEKLPASSTVVWAGKEIKV
jgi:hypothetical protein